MIGQTFGHYRIESKLGEGGVPRAVDLAHAARPSIRPPANADNSRVNLTGHCIGHFWSRSRGIVVSYANEAHSLSTPAANRAPY